MTCYSPLYKHLVDMPLYRSHGFPPHSTHVALMVDSKYFPKIDALVAQYSHVYVDYIVVLGDDKALFPPFLTVKKDGVERQLPLINTNELKLLPHLEKVLYGEAFDAQEIKWANQIAAAGLQHFYMDIPYGGGLLWGQPVPDFYQCNRQRLERAYSLFFDDYSRNVFAARVKSVMTKNMGYTPLSTLPAYHHAKVWPQEGYTVIDGGVSENITPADLFSASVGESGQVWSFEPIPKAFDIAKVKAAQYPNIYLQCAGLGSCETTVAFVEDGGSSRVSQSSGQTTVTCRLTTIDNQAEANGLDVDYIKLDIEGSELDALEGAERTLKTRKPKLAICLYHKHEDLWEIPEYIVSLNLGYKLYLANHTYLMNDLILYATAE